MTITEFAAKYRLKVRRDAHSTGIIPGRPALSHIYEYSDTELGVMFLPYKSIDDPARPRLWHSLCREAITAGMVLRQNGDAEGCLSFDPSDDRQAKLAMRIAGAKAKRRMSAEQRAAKAAILAAARSCVRSNPVREATLAS